MRSLHPLSHGSQVGFHDSYEAILNYQNGILLFYRCILQNRLPRWELSKKEILRSDYLFFSLKPNSKLLHSRSTFQSPQYYYYSIRATYVFLKINKIQVHHFLFHLRFLLENWHDIDHKKDIIQHTDLLVIFIGLAAKN